MFDGTVFTTKIVSCPDLTCGIKMVKPGQVSVQNSGPIVKSRRKVWGNPYRVPPPP